MFDGIEIQIADTRKRGMDLIRVNIVRSDLKTGDRINAVNNAVKAVKQALLDLVQEDD